MSIRLGRTLFSQGTRQIGRAATVAAILSAGCFASGMIGQQAAHDPGVRVGAVNAGRALNSVLATPDPGPNEYFNDGLDRFKEVDEGTGREHDGLGPRFNSDSCVSCHSQPAPGGSSPSASVFPNVGMNPEFLAAGVNGGGNNRIPSFITADGPAREARFKFFLNNNGSLSNTPDGGVHDFFVISGRSDGGSCAIRQPDFAHNLSLNNVSFRIPTPVFCAGLVENIADETILNNM